MVGQFLVMVWCDRGGVLMVGFWWRDRGGVVMVGQFLALVWCDSNQREISKPEINTTREIKTKL